MADLFFPTNHCTLWCLHMELGSNGRMHGLSSKTFNWLASRSILLLLRTVLFMHYYFMQIPRIERLRADQRFFSESTRGKIKNNYGENVGRRSVRLINNKVNNRLFSWTKLFYFFSSVFTFECKQCFWGPQIEAISEGPDKLHQRTTQRMRLSQTQPMNCIALTVGWIKMVRFIFLTIGHCDAKMWRQTDIQI